MWNARWRILLTVAALGAAPTALLADEIVHFTNGAELAVHNHTVDKDMVKLDLGGNSSIAFPMSMVDKIVSAGQDVFLNPVFHPSNQAVDAGAGGAATAPMGSLAAARANPVADTTVRGAGASVGFNPQAGGNGTAGVMLGEAADSMRPRQVQSSPELDGAVVNKRVAYNPAFPSPPGGLPQTINPPGSPKQPVHLTLVVPKPQETTPPPTPTPPPVPMPTPPPSEAPPPPSDPPDDPPENP
jgi:hypothetical protein